MDGFVCVHAHGNSYVYICACLCTWRYLLVCMNIHRVYCVK